MGFGGGGSASPQAGKMGPPEPAGAPATDQNIERPIIQNRYEGVQPKQQPLLGTGEETGSLLSPKKANTY